MNALFLIVCVVLVDRTIFNDNDDEIHLYQVMMKLSISMEKGLCVYTYTKKHFT